MTVVVATIVAAIVAIDRAIRFYVSNLTIAKTATDVGEALSFIFGKARGITIIVIVVVAIVAIIVVVIIVTRIIVITSSHILLPSVKTFVHIVELNTNIVDFHWYCLGGG